MIGSAFINKIMARVLTPALRDIGFTKFKGRMSWRYFEDHLWVFQLKSVGAQFSQVTGFPPASLTANLSIFYKDFPDTPPADVDTDGQLIPKEYLCQVRYTLDNVQDQTALRSAQMLPMERNRKDVWWIEPDGSNAEAALEDIKKALLEVGLPLLQKPYNERSAQLRRRS